MSARESVRFDIAVALLLGSAAVATAWSGYQCVRWGGRQAHHYNEADALRLSSNRVAGMAVAERQLDLAMFANWLHAYANNRPELQEFMRQRFRPEFHPPFEEWLASRPITNPAAPSGPFVLPSYKVAKDAEAHRLLEEANAAAADANRANEVGDQYQLLTVSFSVVLFLAGAITPLRSSRVRLALLIVSIALLLHGVFKMARYPIE